MGTYFLECCVDSVESALAAAEGGADRLELCAGLIIGGISPGLALLEQVRMCCDLPVRVLLRPRFGDFLYTEYEFRILQREVALFREAGADEAVLRIKSLEAFEKAADGQATKIIIPSEIQGLAGLAASAKEIFK